MSGLGLYGVQPGAIFDMLTTMGRDCEITIAPHSGAHFQKHWNTTVISRAGEGARTRRTGVDVWFWFSPIYRGGVA